MKVEIEEIKRILRGRIAHEEGKKKESLLGPMTLKSYQDGRMSAFQLILDEIELMEKMQKEGGE